MPRSRVKRVTWRVARNPHWGWTPIVLVGEARCIGLATCHTKAEARAAARTKAQELRGTAQ